MEIEKIEPLLAKFKPIMLSELDSGTTLMDRVDTKFIYNVKMINGLFAQMKKHYRVLEIEKIRVPRYQTLYYDDKEFTSFIDHHEQKDDRYKIRFRRYVESNITFLEVKHRIGLRTEKTRIQVDKIKQKLSKEQIKFVTSAGVRGDAIRPALYNNFNRITFVSKVDSERVTMDIHLVYRWNGKKVRKNNIVIAELKQPVFDEGSVFFKLMEKREIKPFRVSKYCTGIMLMHGNTNMKFSRFNGQLEKIKKEEKI